MMIHRSWVRLACGTLALGLAAAGASSCGGGAGEGSSGSPSGANGGSSGTSGVGGGGGSNGGGAGSTGGGGGTTAVSGGGAGSSGAGTSGGNGASGSAIGASGSSGSSAGVATGGSGTAVGSAGTAGGAAGGASGGTSGTASAQSGASGSATGTGGTSVAFDSARVVVTGLRDIASPAAETMVNLHNGGTAAVTVTKLSFSGSISLAANKSGGGATYSVQTPTGQNLFQATATLPATIMPGADLPISVVMTTSGATLPAEPPGPKPYDSGSNLFTDTLTATLSTGTAVATVYGLLLVQDAAVAAPPGGFGAFTSGYESTLGQILTTLGYQVDVGAAQTDWNPNTAMVATMLATSNPFTSTELQTAGGTLFVKAGTGMVTMTVVARFSPQGSLDFGYYTPGSAAMRTKVGTMQLQSDPQTSDLARMVYPPLTGMKSTGAAGSVATFDPGAGSFGLYIYSDQMTQKFNEGGTMSNGDYDYSQDSLNSPAGVHRVKVFPLADATGTPITQNYLIAVEEASNGDYQDYVFVLSNVNVAP